MASKLASGSTRPDDIKNLQNKMKKQRKERKERKKKMMENIFARRIAAVVNVNLVMINQVLANCLAIAINDGLQTAHRT